MTKRKMIASAPVPSAVEWWQQIESEPRPGDLLATIEFAADTAPVYDRLALALPKSRSATHV